MKIRKGFVSNSSSTSFVCDTTMSVDKAKEVLETILTFYNNLFGSNHRFDGIFKHPFIADKDYEKCMRQGWNYKCPIGSLVIESATDNSIPYELFELIQKKFNGYYNHLG